MSFDKLSKEKKSEIIFLPPFIRREFFGKDWFLNQQFQSDQRIDWGLNMHLIPELWRVTKGSGIKIAILDTGIDKHDDLSGAIIDCADFTGTGCQDTNGHGTLVAGIVGARDNSIGITGVAPESKLYIGKTIKNNGEDNVLYCIVLLQGLEFNEKKNII